MYLQAEKLLEFKLIKHIHKKKDILALFGSYKYIDIGTIVIGIGYYLLKLQK